MPDPAPTAEETFTARVAAVPDDLTERQTTDILGVSVRTVQSKAHAALRKLRAESAELAELIGSTRENGASS
jgi:DNA-directed RNA polymerase specialized sigma24 family protein